MSLYGFTHVLNLIRRLIYLHAYAFIGNSPIIRLFFSQIPQRFGFLALGMSATPQPYSSLPLG